MECPRCNAAVPDGTTKCGGCGYDPTAAQGRPFMESDPEQLPPPARSALNSTSLLGLAIFCGGVALLVNADRGFLSNLQHRTIIAWVAVAVGIIRFLRGQYQSVQ